MIIAENENILWEEVEKSLFEFYKERGLVNAAAKARAKIKIYKDKFKDEFILIRKDELKAEMSSCQS